MARGPHQRLRHQAEHNEDDRRRADEDQRDAAVIGEEDRSAGQHQGHQRGGGHIAPARPAALARDLVAKQRGDRHVMRAPERPEREGAGGEQAVDQRQRKLRRVNVRLDRKRNDAAEGPVDQEGQGRADRDADDGADQRQHQHLRQIDSKDAAAGRAHRFHGGDHVALAVEMALHGIGDADAAHQQSGEPDQREILREALDVARKLRRGIAAAADFPPGVRQLRLRCIDNGRLIACSPAAFSGRRRR